MTILTHMERSTQLKPSPVELGLGRRGASNYVVTYPQAHTAYTTILDRIRSFSCTIYRVVILAASGHMNHDCGDANNSCAIGPFKAV
eukprot:4870926-Prymnesium_polylepis.1